MGIDKAFHIPMLWAELTTGVHCFSACYFLSRSIVLKDLVAIDTQSKDMLNPAQGLVNMNKYRNLWRIFTGIRSSQLTPPLITPNLDRMRVLRVGGERERESDMID